MNTLSLFNGMGCVWLAQEMAGVKVGIRYSSEIEKFPNQANDSLYPDTIQLGDVRNVDVLKLDRISFLAGGSPCQSFSFAGKRKGMAAKKEFVEPTKDQWLNFVEISDSDMDFEDYIEWQRTSHEIENKELIEILTLEHYLQLKEEDFEFEGQSYLFWEYIRILTDIRKYNPDVKFLLENVIMGSKWQKVITQAIGINPIRINAALVSAQNRDRLFWTNIHTEQDGFFGDLKCVIAQPKDEGILLKDVLETFETSNYETQEEFDAYMKKYFLSDKMIKGLTKHNDNSKEKKRGFEFKPSEGEGKAKCVRMNNFKMGPDDNYVVHNTMPRSSKTGKGGTGHLSRTDGKTYCLDTGNTNAIEIQCVAMRGRNPDNPKSRVSGLPTEQQLEPRMDGKTICLTSVQKDNLVMLNDNQKAKFNFNPDIEKSGCLTLAQGRAGSSDEYMDSVSKIAKITGSIRRLTPRECGRLQSVPEDKLDILLDSGISDTQLYKMFGNGWNIKVIAHILKYLK